MQFKDLLDVLERDEQLIVTVTGYRVYKGSVEHFKEKGLVTSYKSHDIGKSQKSPHVRSCSSVNMNLAL